MKKEHMKDLSLLYYDFNNSKARLMSKMKKMSDFVIHEEAEADNEGAGAGNVTEANEHKSEGSPTKTTTKKFAEVRLIS